MINAAGFGACWTLLSFHAKHFVNVGVMYEEFKNGHRTAFTNPGAVPNASEYAQLMELLSDLRGMCNYLKMSVSTTILDRIIIEFSANLPVQGILREKLDQWYACFTSELESQLILIVLPHRHSYYSDQDRSGDEISELLSALSLFPDANSDAREAGNCFAFERFTACVYHLMRVSEFGLVSVARTIAVPEDKISKGWDGCIQGIESAIKGIASTKPRQDWQDQIKRYSELCSWFTAIKLGWRNPVSHVPRTYSEGSASGMFAATRTLFQHLKKSDFKQVDMPHDPIDPPQDV